MGERIGELPVKVVPRSTEMAKSGCSSIFVRQSSLLVRTDSNRRSRNSQPSFLRSLTRLATHTLTLTPPPAGWLGSDRLHYHGETILAQPGVETRIAFVCRCGGLQGGFSAPGGDRADFGFSYEACLLLFVKIGIGPGCLQFLSIPPRPLVSLIIQASHFGGQKPSTHSQPIHSKSTLISPSSAPRHAQIPSYSGFWIRFASQSRLENGYSGWDHACSKDDRRRQGLGLGTPRPGPYNTSNEPGEDPNNRDNYPRPGSIRLEARL